MMGVPRSQRASRFAAAPLLVTGTGLSCGAIAGMVSGGPLAWVWVCLAMTAGSGVALWFLMRRAAAAEDRLEALLETLPPVAANAVVPASAHEDYLARVQAVVEREREMRLVANSVHGLEALFLPDRRLRWISPSSQEITGFSPEECLAAASLFGLLVHQTDRAYCAKQAELAFKDREATNFEVRLEHRDGRVIWVACHWTPVIEPDGRLSAVRMSAEPIQARKEAELRMLESVAEMRRARSLSEHYLLRTKDERQRLSAVLDAIRPGIVLMDTDQRVQYLNQSFMQMWGFDAAENLFGLRDVVLFGRCEQMMVEVGKFREHVIEVLQQDHSSPVFEFCLKDERVVTDSSVVITREGSETIIGRVWIFEDITAMRRSAEILQQQAERDALTGLYNRRRFDEELDREIAESGRRERQTGLLVFDLDGFKPVNDTHGHQAGDQVLVSLAEAISRVVRRHEMLFRFGGDEFAILVPESEDSHLQELARRVVECVAETPFRFDGQEVRLTASVGVACHPQDATDVAGLVAAADAAMYRAKSAGKNRWATSTNRPVSAQSVPGAARFQLESDHPDPD